MVEGEEGLPCPPEREVKKTAPKRADACETVESACPRKNDRVRPWEWLLTKGGGFTPASLVLTSLAGLLRCWKACPRKKDRACPTEWLFPKGGGFAAADIS